MSKLSLIDRFVGEGNGIDVLLLTLDAEPFLMLFLKSLYAEVPVARLLVCDGGSKDETANILKQFPRVNLNIRPDIRTTGKALEFLISKAKTEWIMCTDADLTFPKGWYDEMCRYRSKFDAFDSKRMLAYEFYREDPASERLDVRPFMNSPQMGKLEALKNFRVDDDYVQRITDIAARQTIEKGGYRYGKVTTTYHLHHAGEEISYKSDESKAATKLVFEKPKEIVINEANWRKRLMDNAKGYVKYIDPNATGVKNDQSIDHVLLPLLDRRWVLEHGPAWIDRYDLTMKRANRRRIRALLHTIDSSFHRIDHLVHKSIRHWLNS